MKQKTKSILSVILTLFSDVLALFSKRRRCAAYRRGWCKGNCCAVCTPTTDEELDAGRLKPGEIYEAAASVETKIKQPLKIAENEI